MDEIQIADCDPHWPRLFEEERALLERVLPARLHKARISIRRLTGNTAGAPPDMTDADSRKCRRVAAIALMVAMSMLTGHFATRALWPVSEPAAAVQSPRQPEAKSDLPERYAYQGPEPTEKEAAFLACYDEADVQISWREFYQKTMVSSAYSSQWLDLRSMSWGKPMNTKNMPADYKNFTEDDWCKLALATVKAMGPSDAPAEFRSVHQKKRHVERVAAQSSILAWAPNKTMTIDYRMRAKQPVCRYTWRQIGSLAPASPGSQLYSWADCHRMTGIADVKWLVTTPLPWEDATPTIEAKFE